MILIFNFSSSDNDTLAWIDTEGWDDADSDDTETFQTILQFLNRHDLTRLKAILWTVHPGTIRQDATLNKGIFINCVDKISDSRFQNCCFLC